MCRAIIAACEPPRSVTRRPSEYLPYECGDLLRVTLVHRCEYRSDERIARNAPIELREERGQRGFPSHPLEERGNFGAVGHGRLNTSDVGE